MSGFSKQQLKALTGSLARSAVRNRTCEGKTLQYIEGWFALAEANRIFGYGGWGRGTVHLERAFDRAGGEGVSCGYLARARRRGAQPRRPGRPGRPEPPPAWPATRTAGSAARGRRWP